MSRTTVYLALGSNLGDRLEMLRHALGELHRAPHIDIDSARGIASVYETAPVGVSADQPAFLNTAIVARTDLGPHEVLARCMTVERMLGRTRRAKDESRIIDIDILLFGDLVCEERNLTIPHPRMHERRFVLEPLAEIAADVVHPVLGTPIGELVCRLRKNANDQAVALYHDGTWCDPTLRH